MKYFLDKQEWEEYIKIKEKRQDYRDELRKEVFSELNDGITKFMYFILLVLGICAFLSSVASFLIGRYLF